MFDTRIRADETAKKITSCNSESIPNKRASVMAELSRLELEFDSNCGLGGERPAPPKAVTNRGVSGDHQK